MRCLVLLFIWTVTLGEAFAAAGGSLDRTANGDGVTVTLTSPFSDLPPGGCVPYQVNVRNDRNAPGTWQIVFQAASMNASQGSTYFEQELTVAPNATGTFDLLVPLPAAPESGNLSLTIKIKGPGFDNSPAGQYFTFIYSNIGGARIPFAIIGKNVLGNAGTGPLESYYKDRSSTYYGSEIDVETLPSDWRAYSAVARILLTDGEWLALTPTQRQAVTEYVAQGGRLTLLTSENLDSRVPELQLPEHDAKPGPYGFGDINVQAVSGFPLDPTQIVELIERDPAPTPGRVDFNYSSWALRSSLGKIMVDGGFIFGFVFLFVALIGPVNLFVFARGKKRFRLFWTTPAISILASALLIAGILVTDGLGGRGKQIVAIYSLPGSNREAVIQEQVARTAVLFSRRWRSDQDYLISPISDREPDESGPGYRSYRAVTAGPSSDTYYQVGNEYSGNWFRSRSVSSQYLQSVRPSRSSLTVLNPDAVNGSGAAPVVLSSFPAELSPVFLVDLQGHVWTCGDLPPGRKATCVASTVGDLKRFWSDTRSNAGGKLNPLLVRASDQPGCFYATGQPAPGETLDTLGEIRWQVVKQIYLGPWVASTAPENGT